MRSGCNDWLSRVHHLVVDLILFIEWWLFSPDYMSEWFQDRKWAFSIGGLDYVHLAGVVATLGTLTGALGGGFHGCDTIREIALFQEEP